MTLAQLARDTRAGELIDRLVNEITTPGMPRQRQDTLWARIKRLSDYRSAFWRRDLHPTQ